jgi:hypothetical protein
MDPNVAQEALSGTTQAWQSPDAATAPGLPAGYQTKVRPDGSKEVVPPPPAGQKDDIRHLTVWCLLWDAFIVVAVVSGIASMHGSKPTPPLTLVVFSPFVVMGAAGTGLWLSMIFLRTSWIVGPGSIARRRRVPLVGLDSLQPYPDAQQLEIRHGIWTSRRGSTDILRVRTSTGVVKIREVYHSAYYAGLKERATNPATGKMDYRALWRLLLEQPGPDPEEPIAIAPEIASLARFMAEQTGLPLETVEEQIPQPKQASQRVVQ